MLEDDAQVRGACQAGGVHELAFAQGEELCTDQTSQGGPEEQTHDHTEHDGVPDTVEVVTGQLTEHGGQQHQGDDDDHVGKAHDDGFNPAAVVACQATEEHAEETGDAGNQDDHQEGVLHTAHGHGKEVATGGVLAEPVLGVGGCTVHDGVHLGVVVLPPARDGANPDGGEG